MRIAIVHSYYSNLEQSGENNVVDSQVAFLTKMGHQVALYSSFTIEKQKSRFYQLRAGFNVLLGVGDDPEEYLTKFCPDIVLMHNLYPNISSSWLRKFGPITFAFKHNYRDVCASGNLYRNGSICLLCVEGTSINGVINRCYKGSALMSIPVSVRNSLKIELRPELTEPKKFLVLSNKMKEILQNTGLNGNRFEVISNFISDPYLGDFKTTSRNHRWVASGRLTVEKGFSELVDCWPTGYGLDIYGEGPMLEELKRKTENRADISIKGGVKRRELSKLLPTYSGALLPSRWYEPGPLMVLEYLAAGLPIISTGVWSDAAGLEASYHIGNVDATGESISEQLVVLMENLKSNIESISQIQREKYLNGFTPDHWYRRLIEIIEH